MLSSVQTKQLEPNTYLFVCMFVCFGKKVLLIKYFSVSITRTFISCIRHFYFVLPWNLIPGKYVACNISVS